MGNGSLLLPCCFFPASARTVARPVHTQGGVYLSESTYGFSVFFLAPLSILA